MAKQKLRNRELYQRLCDVFGRRGVEVHKPGQAAGSFSKETYRHEGNKRVRMKWDDSVAGEEYSVNCPFCNDTRGRLYINHLWGTEDKYSKRRILWAFHCYNEECQTEFENRKELSKLVFDDDRSALEIDESVKVERREKDVRLPGSLTDLLVLARLQPTHPAVLFCYKKGYCLHELSKVYGVGLCEEGRFPGDPIEGRIVVPWYTKTPEGPKLAGWTARKINDDPEDPEAKWMHASAPTGKTVYGLSQASKYQTVVVGEGPGDRWAVGPQGTAVLGKNVNETKANLIVKAMRNDPNSTIIVMSDPLMDSTEKRKGKKHHIDAAVELFGKIFKGQTLGIYLPNYSDPGCLDREYLWDYIFNAAESKGVRVSHDKVR